MDDWLENAQEEWWNGLTEEEKERERAEAIMEDRRCEELEMMVQAARIADYEQMARNEIMLDGEQHPEPDPKYDDIPF